jgi:hypothetical protein
MTILMIQKKIVVAKLRQMLSSGTKTRAVLKRSAGFPSDDVEKAIDYGDQNNFLKVQRQGYVEIGDREFTIIESAYYSCISRMLEKHYRERLTDDGKFLVSKTARKDTKVAGRWTRPDFTIVANRKFPYIRESEFDIITFEVKRPADCEAIAVFEALAHNSAATRSYVFFPVTETEFAKNPQCDRIREECVRHGIGMFLVKDSYSLNEALLIVESQRRPLNPERCSQFLSNVLEPKELATLTTWP